MKSSQYSPVRHLHFNTVAITLSDQCRYWRLINNIGKPLGCFLLGINGHILQAIELEFAAPTPDQLRLMSKIGHSSPEFPENLRQTAFFCQQLALLHHLFSIVDFDECAELLCIIDIYLQSHEISNMRVDRGKVIGTLLEHQHAKFLNVLELPSPLNTALAKVGAIRTSIFVVSPPREVSWEA